MHRTTLVPRFVGWSLLTGCLLHALAQGAAAQGLLPGQEPQLPGGVQQPKDVGMPKGVAKEVTDTFVLVLQKDSTRQIEMSTKELITEFRSENPRVVKVQALLENPRAVLVTGIGPGSTRIYLTDAKRNTESLEVRVPLDDEADREAKRRDLLEQIRRAVPTANVDVVASGNGTVILTGTVASADSAQVIMELARGVFGLGANIINAMRVGGVQQVQLDVVVAFVNRSEARNVAFSFIRTGQQSFLSSTVGGAGVLAAANTVSVLNPASSLTGDPNIIFGVFNDQLGFAGYLRALRTEGLAKVISEPKVVTLSGRPAYIVSGGETPILTSSGQGAPTVTYRQFGTVVNFLPIVLGNGKIHLEVRPEISNINRANSIEIPSANGTTSVPGFDTRSAQVAVQIEDGQTLAIGGLIQNTVNATNVKVPVVGDLPILGFLFSSKLFTEVEEELIILVTPRLVDPLACCQLPKYLPGRETRSADDFELFLEGIMEAPRGPRDVGFPHYKAAHVIGGGPYPCGDNSGLGRGRGHHHGCGTSGCGPTGCTNTYATVNMGTPVTGAIMQATTPADGAETEIRNAVDNVVAPTQAPPQDVPPVRDLTPPSLPSQTGTSGPAEIRVIPQPSASFGAPVPAEPR